MDCPILKAALLQLELMSLVLSVVIFLKGRMLPQSLLIIASVSVTYMIIKYII